MSAPASLITAGSLVPPRKRLAGGWIYDGYPATPVREIGAAELAEAARRDPPAHSVGARHGDRSASARRWTAYARASEIDAASRHADRTGARVRPTLTSRRPHCSPATSTSRTTRASTSAARSSPATAGSRSDRARTCRTIRCSSPMRARGPLVLGADVTIGHNVRMGAATIGDHALIGMGSQVGRRRRRRGGRMHRRARGSRAGLGDQGRMDLGRAAGVRVSRRSSREERETFAAGGEDLRALRRRLSRSR